MIGKGTAYEVLSKLPSGQPKAFMGFDGFVDTIGTIAHGGGRPFSGMSDFGRFLIGRRENSCSLEISRHARKMGGNMPLCANALAGLGVPVTCVGSMGKGSPDPAFAEMNPLCSLYPVGAPGECLAVEFSGGKLYMADMSGPMAMHWKDVVESVGLECLVGMAGESDLIGLFNWGELPNIQRIWEGFASEVLPMLRRKPRVAVFDLADCSGRSDEDILSAMSVLRSFRKRMRVVLSANDNELLAVARAYGYKGADSVRAVEAAYACGAMDLLVHHSLDYARVADENGVITAEGIFVENPILVTGGGDHFNAGLCLGLLHGLGGFECAQLGNTVSRLFVSTGRSPSLDDVLNELSYLNNSTGREEGA